MAPSLNWLIVVLAIATTGVRGGSYLRRTRNVQSTPHPTTVLQTTKDVTAEPSELLVAQESRNAKTIVTIQPLVSDGESSSRQAVVKAVTPHFTTPEPPTTRKPVTHSPKLLQLLKKSSPRSKASVLSQDAQKSNEVNKVKITKPERDPLLASGSSPRGARFFSSAASMLSSFVPAVAPPRRARCASAGACLTQQVMEAINATVNGPEPRPIIQSPSQSNIKRVTLHRRPLQRVATTTAASTESTSTKPAIFARNQPRRKDQTTTTVSTSTTTTPEPHTTSVTTAVTEDSKKLTFRKFRILESKTPTTPTDIDYEVTTTPPNA